MAEIWETSRDDPQRFDDHRKRRKWDAYHEGMPRSRFDLVFNELARDLPISYSDFKIIYGFIRNYIDDFGAPEIVDPLKFSFQYLFLNPDKAKKIIEEFIIKKELEVV